VSADVRRGRQAPPRPAPARPTRRRPPRGRAQRRAPLVARLRVSGDTTHEFILLAVTVGLLTGIGLVMTFSASFVQSAAETGDAFGIFQRQLIVSVLGTPPLIWAALSDYRVWRRLGKVMLIAALFFSLIVLVPGIGIMAHGARRWIAVGPFTFQPSEMLKLAVPVYLAGVLAGRWRQLRTGDMRALLLPALPVIGFAAALVMAAPDLETAVLIAVIGGLVLYAAGLPGRIIAAGAGGTFLVGALAIASTPFRRARFAAWLDPMAHADTFGYQTVQGFIALGSGGWFGVGLGQGRGKWLYIPNAHTDFIFAIIGEETGLIGALIVLLLFVLLAVAGIRTARRAADPFGRLLATAITGWLLLQAGMNMGSVVGLLPVTGVTLPLISFGGTSLLFTMLALGILMSISRHQRPVPEPSR
jgi:cell division protein FtsW